ncbi:hypothetical protein D6853_09170 [Butyrivibrio sp. X503]|uniref:hypothetical protein n=1 Tax=Butyrivibrio sp. X503 TaxID=2364878 RepID=UPI000EAA2C27|nr:hypothetical protein [Butyrivibrio sp. X503]RKM55715.1 hypothetical protein D6853_09170 [Butyrivibrio sp. X503]
MNGKKVKPRMKSEMVAEAFTILMEAYIRQIGRVSSGQRLTITMKSYNRYIKFSGFKEMFDICLYKSGDIDLKMKEFCHGDYQERIYAYTDNPAEQDAFLNELRNGLADKLMEVGTCNLVDYHSFMDLLHGDRHFIDSYNYFKREFGHCY